MTADGHLSRDRCQPPPAVLRPRIEPDSPSSICVDECSSRPIGRGAPAALVLWLSGDRHHATEKRSFDHPSTPPRCLAPSAGRARGRRTLRGDFGVRLPSTAASRALGCARGPPTRSRQPHDRLLEHPGDDGPDSSGPTMAVDWSRSVKTTRADSMAPSRRAPRAGATDREECRSGTKRSKGDRRKVSGRADPQILSIPSPDPAYDAGRSAYG